MNQTSQGLPKCYILSGAPLSGKTTLSKRLPKPYMYISRDAIRLQLNGGKHTSNWNLEPRVTKEVNSLCALAKVYEQNVVIDQTCCKASYLNQFIKEFQDTHEIEIIPLSQPLWKLYMRNIWRYLQQSKWIALRDIKIMKKNFENLPWKDYLPYIKQPYA